MEHINKIKNAKRIVFKFGTNVLTKKDGNLAVSRIYSFIESVAELKAQNKEVILVTSGAVGLGTKKLNLDSKPDCMALKQACAAVGQGKLMSLYEEGFERFGITTAQVLLTEDDFSNRHKYLSLRLTLNSLLELGAVPVINQNDAVSSSEIECFNTDGIKVCFGDNDKLSALVMSKLDADCLVMLSDVKGLFNADPRTDETAEIIPVVKEITPVIESYGFEASKRGRGGMKTKIEAAKVATHSGGYAIIANGKEPEIINKIFNGEKHGTVFLPYEQLSSKKRWIAYATNITGSIKVNTGAKNALLNKSASLLHAGVLEVNNTFDKGDVVSIFDENNNEFAKGMVNYSSTECNAVKGKQSDEIENVLGHKNYDALMTRDNIVIL